MSRRTSEVPEARGVHHSHPQLSSVALRAQARRQAQEQRHEKDLAPEYLLHLTVLAELLFPDKPHGHNPHYFMAHHATDI